VEIKPFKKINGNGYSFKEIWTIYDEQFNILRDIVLSLGDKYQVENVSGSDNKIITLNTPYNSNQVFVYCNGVLQWKDRDYRENSPTEIELLFDRKATDDVRIVTIKSNVIKEDLHQYLQDISSVVANAKEQYDSARNLESRLVELYSALQQTHSLYTNNSTTSLVNDLTRLKSEYEKVNTGVTALDKKLKDLISSGEYVLTTLNIDELKALVNTIKSKIDELSAEKSLDIVYPMFGSNQNGPDASVHDVGECTFVGIDKKYWFMIDTFSKSTGDGGYNSIKRAMQENGITKFEFLLITHWHKDHYGNAVRLMNEGLVEKVYVQDVTKYPSGISGAYGMTYTVLKSVYDEHKNTAQARSIPFSSAPTGEIDFHGAKLLFHNNDSTAIAKHNSTWVNENYNNTSICLLVSYIGRNFLAQGDGDKEVMKEYLDILPSNIDLLKSNHHSIATMPLSFRKLRPKDAIITANKWQLAHDTVVFNYQSFLFDMGSNVYFLANQKEDIHISYSSLYGVAYNKKLEVGYPDNCAYTTPEPNGHIFVDCNYNGNNSTGDKDKPFKYLSDAVRFAHINYMKEICVNIAPGDYTGDIKHYNFVNYNANTVTLINFIGLRGKVRFINSGTTPAYLPPIYVAMCDNVTFENITFKVGSMYTSNAVNNLTSFINASVTNATAMFSRCTFTVDNTDITNRETSNSSFNTIHVDSFGSKVKIDTCTFNGKTRYGIRSAEGSVVTVVGSNNINNSVATVYYATEGDINVNGTATKNTSNESTAGGKVSFLDVDTTPTYPNTTRGQVIGTRLSQKYGGKLGYVSDGNGGYSSIDHFNRSGNLDNKPDFEGQFAYDKTNKRVGFALGSSNKSDWLDLSSNNGIGGVKEWKQGGTYNYGDLIKTSNGKVFFYMSFSNYTYNESDANILNNFSGNYLDTTNVRGNKVMYVDMNKHGSLVFSLLHSQRVNTPLPSTNAEINDLGIFTTYYTEKNSFKNQPTQYGQLINLPCAMDDSNESMQIWIEQFSGQMYTRGGNWENPVADRKFSPVYPDDFGLVDVLLFDWITTPADAKNRNVRLKAPFKDYKIITFWLVPDDGYGWMAPCSFHVGELEFAVEAGKRASPNVGGYMVSANGLYWQLKLSDNLISSTNIGDMTWSENCKLMSVTGWPRVHGYDF
jgi:beta-lactamase superfamily II metal-dependent hydrolase